MRQKTKNFLVKSILFFTLSSCAVFQSGEYILDASGKWIFKEHSRGIFNRGPAPSIRNKPPGFIDRSKQDLKASMWQWPVDGHSKVSSYFGSRRGRMHEGIDIPAPRNTQILASRGGVVTLVSRHVKGYGTLIVIDHGDGHTTAYAHARKILVRKGEHVYKGQPVALIGRSGRATGYHLHFEVRRNNRAIDPLFFLKL